jgi:hypothetical protein
MNSSIETLDRLEAEYNRLLREYDTQSLSSFNKIKSIQKRMLKSKELTSLLSTQKINELEALIDGSTVLTMREFIGTLSREKSSATLQRIAEEGRKRMNNR